MTTKIWKPVAFENCLICGDDVEAYTDAPDDLFGDGDEARCVVCHYPGSISVDDTTAYVHWCEEGYPAEAALKIEQLQATIEHIWEYSNQCAILRTEPTTAGLLKALDSGGG